MASVAPQPAPAAAPVVEQAYFNVAQAAAMLGVSRVTIWRWVRAGHLPLTRLGHRTVRIKREDIERLLAQGGAGGPHPWFVRDLPRRARAEGDDGHVARFYESDAFLLEGVEEFIGPGLRAGQAAIVVATCSHRDALEARLWASGLDLAEARASGRFVSVDAAETLARLLVDGRPDRGRFVDVIGGLVARAGAGGRGVRVFGEMVALLAAEGKTAAALRLEELWDDLQQEHPFALLCAYPIDHLDDDPDARFVHEVGLRHGRVVPAEGYTAVADPIERGRAVALLQRKARVLEAEVAQRALSEQRLAMQYEVARVLSQATTLSEAVAPILACICDSLGWEAGALWTPVEQADVLACAASSADVAEFAAASRQATFAPGDGLPGRIWASGEPAWVADVLVDANFPRAGAATAANLHAAFGFPIRLGQQVLGVMEFYSHEIRQPDADLLALMTSIGSQVGQVVDRLRSEAERARLLAREQAARAEAERERQRLREIFLQAPAVIVVTAGPEHVIRVANERFEQLSGLKAEDVVGKRARDVLPAGADPDYLELLDQAYRTGQPRLGKERALRRDAYFDLVCQPLTTADGEVEGLFVHAVDITEGVRTRRQLEQVAAQRQQQLDTLARINAAVHETAKTRERSLSELQLLLETREEFLSSAAHDLKNPLASIKAQAQLLERRAARAEGGIDTACVVEGLHNIDVTTTRMAALVNELLDTARLQLGQTLELNRSRIDLVALAQRLVAEKQQTTDRHVIRLDATTAPTLIGVWDGPRLERVLGNLLDNAVKYSPRGGTITVTLRRQDGPPELATSAGAAAGAPPAQALLIVQDEGVGIPADELPRVFESFHRGANVIGRIEGSGIGLAGARSIIEGHGGTIRVNSQEGVGSTFTVALPIEPD
jgi:excisionase family DNA binding protein/PAS domain S-box-containing protein